MLLVSFCTISICIIFFLAGKTQTIKRGVLSGIDADWKYDVGKLTFVAFAMVLIFASAVRHGFVDTYAYKEMYVNSRNNLEYVNSAPWGVEAGWLYFCYLLNFISPSPNLLLLVSATVIISAYVFLIKKYSCDPILSLYIFFCIEYMDTNNGMRQMFAAALCIIAFSLITEKRIINYIMAAVLVRIAMLFHESAIVCFIIAVVVVGKPLNARTLAALALGVLFWLAPDRLNVQLSEMFEDSKYLGYLDFSLGMSFLRAGVVGFVPAIAAFLYYYKCRREGTEIAYEEGVLLNLLLVNTMFVFMGLNMQYWARFAFYTAVAPIVLLPKLMYSLTSKDNREYLILFAILCYFIFFAYNIYVNIGYGSIGDFHYDVSWTGELT